MKQRSRLGCERGTLSFLDGKTGVSANVTPVLEGLGKGTADHSMRKEASCEQATNRRRHA